MNETFAPLHWQEIARNGKEDLPFLRYFEEMMGSAAGGVAWTEPPRPTERTGGADTSAGH